MNRNFIGADLSGADLAGANLRGASLAGANIRGASLRGADLTGAKLIGANLTDADLTGATLCKANLTGANLTNANIIGANFQGTDLTNAIGLPSAPIVDSIDSSILKAIEEGGSLAMQVWHSECGTTHCRGGWAIRLAGDPGKDLEKRLSCYLAAKLIYEASRPGVPAPDFFASDEAAMEDLRRCALLENSLND